MEAALRAIAEPRRREILRLVQESELPAGQIAAHFDVSRPAISQHLRVLHDAGLVTERREGTRRLYRARPEGLKDVKEFLEMFWDERLLALKQAAEDEEARKGNQHGDEPNRTRVGDEPDTRRGQSRDHLRLLRGPEEDDPVEGDRS